MAKAITLNIAQIDFIKNQKMDGKDWQNKNLETKAKLCNQAVSKLLTGKSIAMETLSKACTALDVDIKEVLQVGIDLELDSTPMSLDHISKVKERLKPFIEENCGTISIFNHGHPVKIDNIYIFVKIKETLSRNRQYDESNSFSDVSDTRSNFQAESETILVQEGIEKYSKIIIFGKPGAGKTTVLKSIANRCIKGEILIEKIPVFIPIMDFDTCEDNLSLLDFIKTKLKQEDLSNRNRSIDTELESLLKSGRLLILLDGLDEIIADNTYKTINKINRFIREYCKNDFVITCRHGREVQFDRFHEVEIADLNDNQIYDFAEKYFKEMKRTTNLNNFMKEMKKYPQIQELARVPLLLSLLCLEYQESLCLPHNRAGLYSRSIETLLYKWDVSRGKPRGQMYIGRSDIYKELHIDRKKDLLSYTAGNSFRKNQFIFAEQDLVRYIGRYIFNLKDIKNKSDISGISFDVLKTIEWQHGLLIEKFQNHYAFGHRTFHEFFAARHYINNDINILAGYVINKNWREVLIISACLLPNSDRLIISMRNEIEKLVANDPEIQRFIRSVHNIADNLNKNYRKVAVRAYYFARDFAIARKLALDIAKDQVLDVEKVKALSEDLQIALDDDLALSLDLELKKCNNLPLELNFDVSLQLSLSMLKEELPHPNTPEWDRWCENGCQYWHNRLKETVEKHFGNKEDIWDFNDLQKQSLQKYYRGAATIVDSIEAGYTTLKTSEAIENSLFLPQYEWDVARIQIEESPDEDN
jgi:DNA-binding Xre family transcriptional regulator/adenylate kinase family enzyme